MAKVFSVKKLATTAILSAFALIAFMIENLFPPLILPGARLGLSNVFILVAVLFLGSGYGYAVLLVKVVLGSIFSGNVSALLYSFSAGLIALTVEIVLLRFNHKFGLIAVSVFGAIINLVVQNAVFCLVTGVPEYLAYSPYLALIGILSGAVIGTLVYLIYNKLPSSVTNKIID